MKNKLSTALLFSSLTLGSGNIVAGENNKDAQVRENQINTTLNVTKNKTATTLAKKTKEESDRDQKVQEILSQTIEKISNLHISEEEKEKIITIIKQSEFQDKFYSLIKAEKPWSIENIILSLILGFGYGYAYMAQIKGQIKDGKEINIKSFFTFGSISGAMMVLNGFVPGSLVYFESFVLAFVSVGIDIYNSKHKLYNKKA